MPRPNKHKYTNKKKIVISSRKDIPTVKMSEDKNGDKNSSNTNNFTQIMTKLSKLDQMAADVVSVKTTLQQLEVSIENIYKENHELKKLNMEHKAQIDNLETEVDYLKNRVAATEQDNTNTKEHVLRLETQQRRDNLIFYGITETQGETDRDCYRKVVDVMSKMNIHEAMNIRIVRCHRTGHSNKNRPRSIIVKLHWFGDRSRIWEARKNLKGSNIWLSENFPTEIEQRRRTLTPVLKEAWRQKKKAVLNSRQTLH